MLNIEPNLSRLAEPHQGALRWFVNNAGQDRSWPDPLPDGTLLATRAKGIYKPRWTKYALSVRQSIEGIQPDRDPVERPDGTWSYEYFQENLDPSQRDSEYTNRGLLRCMEDGVPVGVFRQVSSRPARYRVLGVAAVVDWSEGYFRLEGFSPYGVAHGPSAGTDIGELIKRHESSNWDNFDHYEDLGDEREHEVASIVRRRGQPAFRQALLDAYEGRCAMSGSDAMHVLEACHIRPYRGPQTNTLSNGLLLRSDLHTLFDLGLLAVDTRSMTTLVAPELRETTYRGLLGRPVAEPKFVPGESNVYALDWHRRWSGLSQRSSWH